MVKARDVVTPIIGFILVGFSIYVFISAIRLMIIRDVPSSLLATLIGFVSLSGGITMIRTWSLTRYLAEKKEEK